MEKVIPPAVGQLVAAERLRDQRMAGEPKLVAPFLGVLNLFFLAYFERFLSGERAAESLAFLLFLESALFTLLAVTRYLSVTGDILRRAALFPTRAWDRFLFTGISNLRRPVTLLWWGSVILALLILSHDTWEEILLPAFLFTLLVLCVQMVLAVLLLKAGKGIAVLWGLLACTFGILVASLLFGEQSLIRLLLPVQWVAEAIRGAGEGNLQPTLRALALLACIGGGTIFLARREP